MYMHIYKYTYNLGYTGDTYVPKDTKRAMQLLGVAAQQGHAGAQVPM